VLDASLLVVQQRGKHLHAFKTLKSKKARTCMDATFLSNFYKQVVALLAP